MARYSKSRNTEEAQGFESYWNENDVKTGLEKGTLFEGVIRINPKNYKEAYISAPDGKDLDIFIDGIVKRNRALNGDIVVYTLLPCEEKNQSVINSKFKPQESTEKAKAQKEGKSDEDILVKEKQKHFQACPEKKKLTASQTLKRGTPNSSLLSKDHADHTTSPTEINTANTVEENILKDPCSKKVEFDEVDERKKKKNRRSKRKVKVKQMSLKFNKCSLSGEDAPDYTVKKFGTKSAVETSAKSSDEFGSSAILKISSMPIAEVDEKLNNEIILQKKAKVVYIKEYKHPRRAIGYLKKWPYGHCGTERKWVLFSPKDHRIPRIKISFTSEITNCLSQPNILYLAEITTWDDVNYPLGNLCFCVGESGDLEAETLALLLEHDVDYRPFAPKLLDMLPKLPWIIPKEEIEKRKDFRNNCIFTIDPADARDLDDAVCGRFLKMSEDGNSKLFEISVHIADVSFFVTENTALDELAGDRATSTYLVDRVIPMLPSVLCEHICSLNPGEDRLAFSVEWVINENGEILHEWFGRSVIRSCAKLSYDHAQAVIEENLDITLPVVHKPHSFSDVQVSIKILQYVATILREKRRKQGALRIDLPRLSFNMDWTTRTPTGFRLYELRDSNRLIEEFMLLANMRVAEKIYRAFPEIAVLRCHPPPNANKLAQTTDILQAVGIHLDVSSSATLQQSLLHYGQVDGDPISLGRNLVVSHLLAKPMKCALYICSGAAKSELNFRHFALSVPFYTHFTSPIRRYPDILVHRLLSAALNERPMNHWNPSVLKKILENCNSRKLSAKALQELHGELHLAALIRKTGSIEVKGIVLAVLDHAVDVVLLYLGIVRRLYLDKLPLDELNFRQANGIGTLSLTWTACSGEAPISQNIMIFSVLEILMVPHEKGELQFSLVLQRPSSCYKFATESMSK